MEENDLEKFDQEFDDLSTASQDLTTEIASDVLNKTKNRFKNIHPYDHNMVVLKKTKQFPFSYINASFIDGYTKTSEYIATQGPLLKTTDDFWRMIWHVDCRNIVMLTQVLEGGKKKCFKYWPDVNEHVLYGNIAISTISEIDESYWTIRKFQVAKKGEVRNVTHFHYTTWPDHGVPEESKSMVVFATFVRSQIDEENSISPTTIHCSAGVGRTGTFIAIDCLLQHLNTNPRIVDIFGLVYRMRTQRMKMVQTKEQYVFLHNVVQEYLNGEYENIGKYAKNNSKNENPYQNVEPIYENNINI